MKPYYEHDGLTIYHGDCREVLPMLSGVDHVLTDPPYGLEFMGKDWDHGVPGVEFWRLIQDACKPGAMLMAFGGTRTYHRLVCGIEDAGWEIRDMVNYLHEGPLLWVTGQGFPKSQNFGCKCGGAEVPYNHEQIPKGKGEEGIEVSDVRSDVSSPSVAPQKKSSGVLFSQLSEQDVCGKMPRDCKTRKGGVDRGQPSVLRGENERPEQSGLEGRRDVQEEQRKLHRAEVCEVSAGHDGNGKERWICDGAPSGDGESDGKTLDQVGVCSSQGSQYAEQRAGESGIIPKQSVSQKSRGRTCEKCGGVVEFKGYGTALKPSVEIICLAMKPLDGTFAANALKHGVAGLNIDGGRVGTEGGETHSGGYQDKMVGGKVINGGVATDLTPQGRWPSNLIHDGSESVLQGFPQSSITGNGSAARFFYCAKASMAERGEGNKHPTVKPLALLKYLLTLLETPTGGVVLDPFAGSGSTLVATQQMGRQAIGIELSEEYCEMAARRLSQPVQGDMIESGRY